MAGLLFCEVLGGDFGLEFFFDVHLLESAVLFLELFHPGDQGRIHAAELGAPLVKRRRADADLTAQIGHRQTCFYALERMHDLAV